MEVKPRFIVLPGELEFVQQGDTHPVGVWLTDYQWWHQVQEEFEAWLEEHDVMMEGMIIKFINEQERTAFLLRWT